jgi:AraC-like DNA-binding protein
MDDKEKFYQNHEPYRERCNKKVKWLIKMNPFIPWNPVSIYSDMIWISRITLPQVWPKGYWIKQYCKKYVCVQIILEGDMKAVYDNQTYLVKAGDCIIIPPGNDILSTGPSGMCRKKYFIPSGSMFRNAMKELKFDKLSVIHDFLTEDYNKLYDRVCQLHQEHEQSTLSELAALSFELIMQTASKIGNQEYPDSLVRCMEFIGSNISQKLSLDIICNATGIGKTKLKEMFREHLQTSPGRYIVNLRLNSALKMLEDASCSIKQVAFACGYENPLYFSNAFKARFGVSPRNYLKKYLP